MQGKISKTYIKEFDDNVVFCKLKEPDSFDVRTVLFQSKLSQIINGKFKINKFNGINLKIINGKTYYELQFEKINHINWTPNSENMKITGAAMAHIHNYAFRNRKIINLPYKDEKYDSMQKWLFFSKKDSLINNAYEMRLNIFNKIPRFNVKQVKIPLHRDFKLHNILFDGQSYYLIDFDFAAIDYVNIEIMSFIIDLYEYGIEYVKIFLENYFNKVNVPIAINTCVTDYINYLCTNTFPYYLSNSLEIDVIKELGQYRDKCLETVYNNQEIFNKIIKEAYDSN